MYRLRRVRWSALFIRIALCNIDVADRRHEHCQMLRVHHRNILCCYRQFLVVLRLLHVYTVRLSARPAAPINRADRCIVYTHAYDYNCNCNNRACNYGHDSEFRNLTLGNLPLHRKRLYYVPQNDAVLVN